MITAQCWRSVINEISLFLAFYLPPNTFDDFLDMLFVFEKINRVKNWI